MKKGKKKSEMPLKRKLIIMVLSIAMAICVVAGIFACASNAEEVNNKLTLSDWLVATCSVIALAGTLILSCITITQTAKANETNEKLFKQNEKLLAQNEELQKINDYQFKIANQDKIPVLRVAEIKMIPPDEGTRRDVLRAWKSKWVKLTVVKNQSIARVSVGLSPQNMPPTDVTVLAIILKNESSAVIQKIKSTMINIYGPIKFEEKRDCDLLERPLLKNESLGLFLDIGHLNDTFPSKKFVQMYIDLEIETITGLKFGEKLSLFADESGGLDSIVGKIDDKIIG